MLTVIQSESGFKLTSEHIRPRRLWDYINFKLELNDDEQEHLAACPRCLATFKVCVLAENPDSLDKGLDTQQSA